VRTQISFYILVRCDTTLSAYTKFTIIVQCNVLLQRAQVEVEETKRQALKDDADKAREAAQTKRDAATAAAVTAVTDVAVAPTDVLVEIVTSDESVTTSSPSTSTLSSAAADSAAASSSSATPLRADDAAAAAVAAAGAAVKAQLAAAAAAAAVTTAAAAAKENEATSTATTTTTAMSAAATLRKPTPRPRSLSECGNPEYDAAAAQFEAAVAAEAADEAKAHAKEVGSITRACFCVNFTRLRHRGCGSGVSHWTSQSTMTYLTLPYLTLPYFYLPGCSTEAAEAE
jgi:hypothetical protein